MHLLVVAVKTVKTVDRKLPTNVNNPVKRLLRSIENAWCINNSRESLPQDDPNEDNFQENVESSADIDESDSSNPGDHSTKCYKWMTINEKASKVMVSFPFGDILETLKETFNELKYHLFVRNEHYKI